MSFTRDRVKYLIFSLVYCVVFFLIRIFSSDTLSPDEAEQYFHAQDFKLSYMNQAPLITWILASLNKFIEIDVLVLNSLKYFLFFLFLYVFYLVIEKTVTKDLRSSAFLAIALVPLYSFNFHKDLIQSVSLALFSALAVYLCLRLIEDNSLANYLWMGICMACGVLSKYNFVFIALGIVVAVLSTKSVREKLLAPYGVLASLLFFFILISPHFYGVIENDFSTVAHATNKVASVDRVFFNIETQFRLLEDILLVFALVSIGALFFKVKPQFEFITKIALFSFLALLLALYLMQVKHFMIHWLSPVAFLLPLVLFINSEERFKGAKKIFNSLIVIFILFTIYSSTISQNKISKNNAREVNFHTIVDQIKILYDPKEVILVSNNIFLLANLELHGEFNTKWLHDLSYDHYLTKRERLKVIDRYKNELAEINNKQVVVLAKQDIKKERLPKRFRMIYGDQNFNHKFKNRYNSSSKKHFSYYLWEV